MQMTICRHTVQSSNLAVLTSHAVRVWAEELLDITGYSRTLLVKGGLTFPIIDHIICTWEYGIGANYELSQNLLFDLL